MKLVFLAGALVSAFLFYRLPEQMADAPSIALIWQQPLVAADSDESDRPPVAPPPDSLGRLPYNAVEWQGRLFFAAQPSRVAQPGERFAVPFLGEGYMRYYKLGHEVYYHARNGETLWQRPYSSYPVSDHSGELFLLLTGDNSRVDLINRNGDLVRSVAGSFLVDYDFANRSAHSALLFASGELYLVGAGGELIAERRPQEHSGLWFGKSVAVSSDGRHVAIHRRIGSEESIEILTLKSAEGLLPHERFESIGRIELTRSYPHLLHFAVNRHGLLLAAPELTAFFDLRGRDLWRRPVESNERIYRPVFADDDYFVVGDGSTAEVYDHIGVRLARMPVAVRDPDPWRIVPARGEGQFAIQSRALLQFYRVE